MKIVIHDYCGHPFPVQLSRELARRGHTVLHIYCESVVSPRGIMTKRADDASNFEICAVRLSAPVEKMKFFERRKREIEYGHRASAEIIAFRPDIVLSGNTPLDAQRIILPKCHSENIPIIHWLQDVIGVAIEKILKQRFGVIGFLIGKFYQSIERRLLRSADAIVSIAEDFDTILREWRIESEKIHVIRNWSPINDIPLLPRENSWSQKYNCTSTFNFMYAGTLGMKHNPHILFRLAEFFQNEPSVRVFVISEGLGADWLLEKLQEKPLPNLTVLPYQPFEDMPKMLAAANVLVTILEPDAGIYSIPSKVLTNFCAGKPQIALMPDRNLSALLISHNSAGIVTSPDNEEQFFHNAEYLYTHPEEATALGENARSYAEQTFDIQRITDKFEHVFTTTLRTIS